MRTYESPTLALVAATLMTSWKTTLGFLLTWNPSTSRSWDNPDRGYAKCLSITPASSSPLLHGMAADQEQQLDKAKLPYFLQNDDDGMASSTEPSGRSSTAPNTFWETSVPGPPRETKPDYENIVGPLGRWADQLFLKMFRDKLAEQVYTSLESDQRTKKTESRSSSFPDLSPHGTYQEIIDLAAIMNRRLPRHEIQERARETLVQLFPSWMPPQYKILFSKPFPAFSSRMNAWATYVAGTWLMGECELNDVPEADEGDGKNQGLLVKRCRFLEESGCASVCVNSCKIPTQKFFMENMGLPLLMEPDYETFECQFSFGRTPTVETELVAELTPCLQRCPTAGSLRTLHDSSSRRGLAVDSSNDKSNTNNCPMINS